MRRKPGDPRWCVSAQRETHKLGVSLVDWVNEFSSNGSTLIQLYSVTARAFYPGLPAVAYQPSVQLAIRQRVGSSARDT